ncbi:MAG: methyltransferase [Acidimicrobiales bacterium]
MRTQDHSRLSYKIGYARRHPGRILPYGRRWARDLWLGLRSEDHVNYYRAVMHSDVARSPEAAVGGSSRESWLRFGQLQFDYLLEHGLAPDMRVLEIGCGNLRAGRLLVDYLDAGNYYGIDISPDILLAALDTVTTFGLQPRLPRLTLVQDLKLDFLPDEAFEVVHAHSVFSHSPIEVVDECLCHVGRVMTSGGFFDFTFKPTDGDEHQVLHEDFYYRAPTLIALAARYGLRAQVMDDWRLRQDSQCKLRVTRSAPSGALREPGSS